MLANVLRISSLCKILLNLSGESVLKLKTTMRINGKGGDESVDHAFVRLV